MTPAPEIRFIPLGGLGEFGLNSFALECAGRILLIDAGLMFPHADLPGVDSIVPDFSYLAERKDAVEAIVLTHGHEDHIGALSFALAAAPAPVYGTPLTLGLARRRLRERGMSVDARPIAPNQPVAIGPFVLHPIAAAHSIPQSLALAIETPAGIVIVSGDFKLNRHARPEERTDLAALARLSDRGVLLLLSDSTNVEIPGESPDEDTLVDTFQSIFATTRGRLFFSCFASAIPRMQRIIDLSLRHGRKIAFVGKRMIENAEEAIALGLLRMPDEQRVMSTALNESPVERQTLLVSGSQGESLSALALMSVSRHRDIAIQANDTVVISARLIPGNERAVSRLIDNLYRKGCHVVHPGTARVHVSGHGYRGDLAEMLATVRPRYFIPVHGEYRMLAQHAQLACETGLAADQVRLVEDGQALCLSERGVESFGTASGRIFLDRAGLDSLEDEVIRDRRHISNEGVIVPVMVIDRHSGRLEVPPEIVSRGFGDASFQGEVIDAAHQHVIDLFESMSLEEKTEPEITRERVRIELRRFFKKRTQRRPLVIPVVMEV
jgi:ribonuclease J